MSLREGKYVLLLNASKRCESDIAELVCWSSFTGGNRSRGRGFRGGWSIRMLGQRRTVSFAKMLCRVLDSIKRIGKTALSLLLGGSVAVGVALGFGSPKGD